MIKPKHTHQDPFRYPKLQEPIENGVVKRFNAFRQGILVDVTKILVNKKKP